MDGRIKINNAHKIKLNKILKKEKTAWERKKTDEIIQSVKNCFKLKREINCNGIQSIRNLFRLTKENETIKGRIIRDIRKLSEQENDDYYKPVRVGNFWSKKYIEYESNEDRKKKRSLEEYLNKKTRSYLKDIIKWS